MIGLDIETRVGFSSHHRKSAVSARRRRTHRLSCQSGGNLTYLFCTLPALMHHLLVEDSAENFGFFYCCWASLQPGLEVFMIMDCTCVCGGDGVGFQSSADIISFGRCSWWWQQRSIWNDDHHQMPRRCQMVIMQLAAYALIFYRDILMSSQKCLKGEERFQPPPPPPKKKNAIF